ncbi:MAG: PEP/pyruvate-binding domain-containing protein [Candidatus Thorarchaeota archaeon]
MNLLKLFTNNIIDSDTSTVESSGGKGHNLVMMKKDGLNVPSGLIVPTEVCNAYRQLDTDGKSDLMDQVIDAVMDNLEKHVWADAKHKLLSIRSGAPVSMPGMMDTVLNVGAGYVDDSLESDLQADCRKRFVDMYADVVMGHKAKIEDSELWLTSIKKHIPELRDVIRNSIEAVFNSWDNERAIHYRKMNDIPDDMGTAVVIQSMVFGNNNDKSGSGVLFTRNPSTGENKIMGEYLVNAQGEDVVAGTKTGLAFDTMTDWNVGCFSALCTVANELEEKYNDMQDIEFTIQDEVVYILQCRKGKRTPYAEIKIAFDLLEEGKIKELGDRVSKGTFSKLRQPTMPANFKQKANAKGIGAGGYLATGKAAFSVADVLNASEPTILVAEETTPDDIKGMEKALGILTYKGGSTSHAAVVARGMNKTCVVGCADATTLVKPGMYVLINGQSGEIYLSSKPFEIDMSGTIPVDLLGPLFELCIDENDWVEVASYDEAINLEDYLFKIGIPVEGLTSDQLADLADRFDKIVLINPDRRDSVSDFLGTPDIKGMSNARTLDEDIANNPAMSHVFFDAGDWVTSNVAKPYKTMADVMDMDFVGYIDKEFIDTVMGDAATFEKISEQLGLASRVVDLQCALTILESRINIG